MVAVNNNEPDLLQEPSAVEPAETATDAPLAAIRLLSAEDRALLERVAGHVPLLADLTHADAVLFARAGDQVVVVAQAQPVPVPSPYALPVAAGRGMLREETPRSAASTQ